MSTTDPVPIDHVPIGDLALLGDGRAVALVTRDGAVAWLDLPAGRDRTVCCGLLDADRGGSFELSPQGCERSDRRYLPETNVLETTHHCRTGTVRLTEAFTLHSGALLPWTELARRVEVLDGEVELRWRFRPGFDFGRSSATCRRRDERIGHATSDVLRTSVLSDGLGEVLVADDTLHGSVTMRGGDRGLLTLVVVGCEPIPLPDRDEIEARLERTARAWRDQCSSIEYDGPFRDDVMRSMLVMKLLVHSQTGALMAAPTTSLPEQVAGTRNYDYRYCWFRDAGFGLDAFLRTNLVEDAHAIQRFLLRALDRAGPWIPPFVDLDGRTPGAEVRAELAGYRGSRPVRIGNAARDQLQIGSYGDLLDPVWLYVRVGNELDPHTGRSLAELADHVCGVWDRRDAGIWELPGPRHHTFSKMGAWVTLDRLLRLADSGQAPDDHADRWRREAEQIKRFVRDECWSTRRNSYVMAAGGDDLDAATVLAARNGFDHDDMTRSERTIEAVRRELADGAFVHRYSGMQRTEGAFVACSFWLAEAMARCGDVDGAHDRIEGALRAGNDLGLMSEQVDGTSGELLGNFPQGLSHLAFVNAASSITEVRENG